ncbi:MAG TPA: DUF72 domain-containing protein [Gammaproteobacteria bacterium]
MDLYCGTSGFSFKEWKGPFYPEKLPADEMLAFYGARLPSVEINNTFYRMPKPSVLEGWAAQVPERFRFAVKAPRRLSHVKQLKDCSEEAGYFFGAVATLGTRLGAVLVQLPPHARVGVEKLDAFLELVPAGVPVAFEFRHPSWKDAAVYATLERHGAAWVTADNDGTVPPELPATASWTYLRLRAPEYTEATLREWKARCANFTRAFVYFKHEDGAAGPAFAERMLNL